MSKRPMPRSFFWIDQHLIRSGAWEKLSSQARLTYVALSAGCDRSGVSFWPPRKLMDLAAIDCKDSFLGAMSELSEKKLIENLDNGGVRLVPLERPPGEPGTKPEPPLSAVVQTAAALRSPQAIVVHTTVHIGGERAEPGSTS